MIEISKIHTCTYNFFSLRLLSSLGNKELPAYYWIAIAGSRSGRQGTLYMQMLWFNFILNLNFIFLCFWVW